MNKKRYQSRKEFVDHLIEKHANHQVFFTRNIFGDKLYLHDKFENIRVEYRQGDDYFEIFGLTEDEQKLFVHNGPVYLL
jgi:hypothetical protein